jgi:hypothetical protein
VGLPQTPCPTDLVDADPRVQGTEVVAIRTGELICDRKGEPVPLRAGLR